MEIFEPSNFFELTGLIGSIITALIALAGLFIGLLTYKVAEKALSTWRLQKTFDIDIEGYSLDAIKLLEDLSMEQYNIDVVKEVWGEVLSDIVERNENDVYKSFINLFSYSQYYNNVLKDRMFEMRKQAIKVLNVSNDKKLIDFYDKYITVEANLFAIHHNYHISKINDFIDKYDYQKFNKESFAISNYFNAVRKEDLTSSDVRLYEELYRHFFKQEGGDPLQGLRAQHISFYFQKLKN